MAELGNVKPQGLKELDLLRRIGNVFLRAEHVGHAHQMVVNDDGEVIRRRAIGLGDDEIIELGHIEIHTAVDQVVDPHGAPHGHLEANGMGFPRRKAALHLFLRQIAARAGIPERLFPRLLDFPLGFQLFRRAEAVVGLPFIQQLLQIFLVDLRTLRLEIGRARPPDFRTFVPVQPQPLHAADDLFHRTGFETARIRIFNA